MSGRHHHNVHVNHHPHHNSHHNVHHGMPLAGALIGGAALGLAAVALSSPPPPTYVVVPPPPRLLTPEEIAERNEKRRLADEARRLENAARQAEIERRIAESTRIRLENERTQDENEKTRCTNFQAHLQLINEADTMPYDGLKARITALNKLAEPISRFRNTPYSGIPETKGRDLLGCILFNPQLTIDNQRELLNMALFNLGYSEHYLKLFQAPLIDRMLNNQPCFDLLAYLYNNMYMPSRQFGIEIETERLICSRLIAMDGTNGIRLFNLINTHARQYQLLKDWLTSRPTATDVIQTYNTIKAQCRLSDFILDGLYKIAKQQILKLELLYAQSQPGMPLNPHENNDEINDFLATHRSVLGSCVSILFKPSSLRISRMISTGQLPEASRAWSAETVKEETFSHTVGIR